MSCNQLFRFWEVYCLKGCLVDMVMIFRWRGGVQTWPPAMRLFGRWIFNEHTRHISTTVCFQTLFWWHLCNADMNFVRTVFGGFLLRLFGPFATQWFSGCQICDKCLPPDLIGIRKEFQAFKSLVVGSWKTSTLAAKKKGGLIVFQSYQNWGERGVFFFGIRGISKYLLSFGVTGCL